MILNPECAAPIYRLNIGILITELKTCSKPTNTRGSIAPDLPFHPSIVMQSTNLVL